jgi:hypothetical protein
VPHPTGDERENMTATTRRVIVITRNSRTIVITGWRAWLTGVGAALLAWFALAVIVFALVGVAISVGVVLLLLIPAIVIVSVVGSLMRKEI